MRIGGETNSNSNEFEMQDLYEKWINELNAEYKRFKWEKYCLDYQREVHIKEIRRRADFLIKKEGVLINVELKTNPGQILIDQLLDHKTYSDYCFALIPDFCLMPKWFIIKLIENGFGLIVFNSDHKVFTETLPAFYNKGRNGKLRNKYLYLLSINQKNIFQINP